MAIVSTSIGEQIKLDLYDKKIIFYLSQDSRMPVSDLAKKLKLSPQNVKYKVNRLKNELLSPAMFLSFNLLNIKQYVIFIENLTEEQVEQLFQDDSVYFIMQSIGKYQWSINVVTNTIQTLIKKHLGENHFIIKEIIRSYADNYNPYNLKIKPKADKKSQKVMLDKKDYQILSELAKDSTQSLLELHGKTGIDRQTIKHRIKKLDETNIIQKFRYSINLFKAGFSTYLLDIETRPLKKQQVLTKIGMNNYSGFIFETLTGLVMHYLPDSSEKLFQFTKSLEEIDSSIKINVSQNTQRFKVDLVPKSVIEIFKEKIKNNF